MALAKIIEVSSSSNKGFDDAVRSAYTEVSRTVRNVKSVWVQDFIYEPDEASETGGRFRVHCKVTFEVESGADAG
jgi:flavin-binding protein dodecin